METIGRRIAYLRQKNNLTQQGLAYRLAMSRVAISHIEMDLTIPSERTITLMAGVFKLSPQELVQGTGYPAAKAERLPEITTTYTELELELALLKNDCLWLEQLAMYEPSPLITRQVIKKWASRLEKWKLKICDEQETQLRQEMYQILECLNGQVDHPLT